MQDYTNENEQWYAIKDWLRKNGLSMVCIFTITLAIGLGWRYWQNYQLTQKEQASQLFDQLQDVQTTDANSELITRISDKLKNDYRQTPYAILSAFFLAKNAVEKGDLQTAQQQLQWALDHAKAADLRDIARIRLARILLADNKPDKALTLLQKVETKSFIAAVSQVQGNIYLSQGKTAQARTAYQHALDTLPANEPIRAYIEMQANRLPAVTP